MKVLGIDPSLTSTGLALVEGGRVIRTERVRSKLKGHERVREILIAIRNLAIDDDEVDIVGIEGPAFRAKGSSVVQIFGLWGIITHKLWEWKVPYYVVPPSNRMKYATGKGQISKDEVLAAVIDRYRDLVQVTGNDVADALIVAAMGARHFEEPLESSLPQTHLKALEGVQWTAL